MTETTRSHRTFPDFGAVFWTLGGLAGIIAFAKQLEIFVYLDSRRWLYLASLVLASAFFLLSYRKYKAPLSLTGQVDPSAVKWRPLFAISAIAVLLAWGTDEGANHFGMIVPADVLPVIFDSHPPSPFDTISRPYDSGLNPPPRFDDCQEWTQVNAMHRRDFIDDRRARWARADNQDSAQSLTEAFAVGLYRAPPGEALEFSIRKRSHCRHLTIVDDDLTVEAFVSLYPTGTRTTNANSFDLICVEIEKRACEQLPWHFSAKYLLDDPQQKSARQWSRLRYVIKDDLQRDIAIKVQAKDRGIYTYTVDLILKDEAGRTFRVPLLEKRRVCAFTGARADDPPEAQSDIDVYESLVRPPSPAPAAPVPFPTGPAAEQTPLRPDTDP
jgi:hypothetical protein